jgi:MFS transporter, DHA1 family, tetracycline resistance protein
MNQAKPSRAAMYFVLITVFLDILAFGLIIPVLPKLIMSFFGNDEAYATRWSGYLSFFFALLQFVFSPIQGALSDRFGRRPVILASNIGLSFDFFIMAIAQSFPMMFIGRLLSGITSASFSTAAAYIADTTVPEKRAEAYGKMGAAFGIGFIVGPAVGGMLSHRYGLHAPFWLAMMLSLANFCYGYFVLPESLPLDKRTPFAMKRANPVASLNFLQANRTLRAPAFVGFMVQLAHNVFPATFVFYAGHRYHWSELEVGWTLAVVGVCAAVVQGGLIGKIIKALGERRALLVGLLCGTIGMLGYGAAAKPWQFFIFIPVMSFWGLATASSQAMMSKAVDPREQGRLQGAMTSLQSIAGIIGPPLFTGIFSHLVATDHGALPKLYIPGATFFTAAAFLGIALLVAQRAFAKPLAAAKTVMAE